MARKCDYCGELAIEDDEQVCQSCGIVADDVRFGPDYVPFTQFNTICSQRLVSQTARRILNKKKPNIGFMHGLSTLKNLCHVFNITSEREEELTELLKNVYPSKKFKKKEFVGILAGCCVFLLQRKYKQPIPMSVMCSQLTCTRKKFNVFLNYLKSWLNENNPNFLQNPSEEENGIFAECQKTAEINDPDLPERAESLISDVCRYASEDQKSLLEEKTAKLVKLVYSCWLYSGRSPTCIVNACAFLCWKSMNQARRLTHFAEFCSALQIHDPVGKNRVSEIRRLLLKLGQQIPSYTTDYVNKKNLLFHLDTILENSETLRNDLLKDNHFQEEINCKEFESFRYPPKTSTREISTSTVTYDSDMNASDIEISDTEIESYIIRDDQKKTIQEFCAKNLV